MASTTLRIYSTLSRLPWPSSFIAKVFLTCFIGTHVPLIAYLVFILTTARWSDRAVWEGGGVVLVATLIGTGFALLMLYFLLEPVRLTRDSLKAYAAQRHLPDLPLSYPDEVGQLMATVQQTIEQVHKRLERLTQEASTDPLTGAGNRRWFDNAAERRLAAAMLVERPVSIAMIDLDHFKRLNDLFGHSAGDAVLRSVAETVIADLRPLDVFARIGGEEFCLLLFDAGLDAAEQVAERLRRHIEAICWAEWPDMRVTASVGVAEITTGETTLDPAMERADAALYSAKRSGRNRVAGGQK